MGLQIVHLSDFHFSLKNKDNHFSKREQLVIQLKNTANKKDSLIVIVSGDIANTGYIAEYKMAADFFQKIRIELKDYYERVSLAFVPGNHDCNLYESDYELKREKCIEDINNRKGVPTKQELVTCLEAQSHFREFEKRNSPYVVTHSMLQNHMIVRNNELDAHIYLLNSAWMSTRNESKTIIMPTEYFDLNVLKEKKDTNAINIIVHHHPRSWFTSNSDISIREIIEDKNAIVLTGHEHTEDGHLKKTESSTLFYSVGGSFDEENSCFKTLQVDKHGNIQEDTYIWDNNRKIFVTHTKEHSSENNLMNKLVNPTKEYLDKLNDIGMLLYHPRKKQPQLDDLFVNPFLSLTTISGKGESIIIKDEDSILALAEEKMAIIDGDYGSGKTTLAKKIIKHYISENNKMAIYLDISEDYEIFSTKVRLKNKFNTILKEQYGTKASEVFNALSKDERLLIIDNYNILLSRRSNVELLHEFINENFNKCLIFSNSQAFSTGNLEIEKYISDFKRYSIEIFGPKLQMKIIEKWNNLENFDMDDYMIENKNQEDASRIRTLLQGNSLPQTPDAILMVLSTMETKKPDKTTLYGHLLTTIISSAMKRANIEDDSQEEIFRILSIFAWVQTLI